MSSIFHRLYKKFDQGFNRIERFYKKSEQKNDVKNMVLCRLEIARLYTSYGRKKKAIENFKKGFFLAKKCDDKYINLKISTYKVYYYSIIGNTKGIVKNCEIALYVMGTLDNSLYDETIPILLAINTAYTSDYEKAIHIIQNQIAQAELRDDKYYIVLFSIYHALIYAIIGDIKTLKEL